MQLPPTILIIFGGAGDLAWRKLLPSLFDLWRDGRLPARFDVLAVDRVQLSATALRERFRDGVRKFSRSARTARRQDWAAFARHIDYLAGDFHEGRTYATLAAELRRRERGGHGQAGRVFYLAVPPDQLDAIVDGLARAGLNAGLGRSRIVVEKPIGHDLESAEAIRRVLVRSFDESQIFRIDHYLGKETVQNILAFRFANPLYEPIWDRRYVERVTITVAETVGVGHRGSYYDRAGALRDMVQNHLLQLLCLVAMEPMVSFDADDIRNKKLDVLRAVRPVDPRLLRENAVRGQYGKGRIGGLPVPGYRQEEGVSRRSRTETFVALRLFVDNWRWEGVPFHLITGKRLPERTSKIAIQFRKVPHQAFPREARQAWHPATLVLSIQPEEAIVLDFQAKYPGPRMLLRPAQMHFMYRENFAVPSPDAYETLLWDVMHNDATLFMRADQVEAAWRLLTPILEAWAEEPARGFPNYAAGSWGPPGAVPFFAEHIPRGQQPHGGPGR